jgi:hypothetical protein
MGESSAHPQMAPLPSNKIPHRVVLPSCGLSACWCEEGSDVAVGCNSVLHISESFGRSRMKCIKGGMSLSTPPFEAKQLQGPKKINDVWGLPKRDSSNLGPGVSLRIHRQSEDMPRARQGEMMLTTASLSFARSPPPSFQRLAPPKENPRL